MATRSKASQARSTQVGLDAKRRPAGFPLVITRRFDVLPCSIVAVGLSGYAMKPLTRPTGLGGCSLTTRSVLTCAAWAVAAITPLIDWLRLASQVDMSYIHV